MLFLDDAGRLESLLLSRKYEVTSLCPSGDPKNRPSGSTTCIFSSDGAQEVHNFVRPFVRSSGVIVRFMCYKGSEGCCKGQEGSRRVKESQERPRRVKKGQEGQRRVKKVQESPRRFKNVQAGSTKF